MKARVYNKHSEGMVHREMFKGAMLEIKPGGFIVMDYEDAVDFRGQYFPIKLLPTGAPDPAGFKMIEIVPIKDGEESIQKMYTCNMDGRQFSSQSELDAYLKANFADQVFKDQALDEQIEVVKKRGRPFKKDSTHDEFKT